MTINEVFKKYNVKPEDIVNTTETETEIVYFVEDEDNTEAIFSFNREENTFLVSVETDIVEVGDFEF